MGTQINLSAQTDQKLPSVKIPAGGAAGYVWTLVNPVTGAGAWMPASAPTPPPPPVANRSLWIKADTGVFSDAGVTPAVDNDPVYQWNDQSGLSNNVIQTTLINRPLFKTSIVNGLPIVRFDGVDDFMDVVFPSPLNQPNTLFLVFNNINAGYIFDGSTSLNREFLAPFTLSTIEFTCDGGGSLLTASSGFPSGFLCLSMVADNAASKMFKNSVLVASGNPGPFGIPDFRFGISGTLTSPGQIDLAEVIVYNALLSDAEQLVVRNYLIAKYGL